MLFLLSSLPANGGIHKDTNALVYLCFHKYKLVSLEIGRSNGNPLGILAWRIPWTGEPGKLQSMGWQTIGHDRATNKQELLIYKTTWMNLKNTPVERCQAQKYTFMKF